jgi:hypothetical protein
VKYETYTTAPKINKIYRIYFSFLENAPTPKKEKANFSKKGMVLSLTKKITMTRFFSLKTCFFFKQISKEPFDYIYIYDRCRHPENIFSNLAFVPTI